MLICIADSEYFNIALKAYINEPNSKPLDIKEMLCYPFSGQSEMFYTFFATDAGARLSTILIDYSSVSIEVLQVALSLKSFNPLIRIFIFAKSGYPLSELDIEPFELEAERRPSGRFNDGQRAWQRGEGEERAPRSSSPAAERPARPVRAPRPPADHMALNRWA